MRLALAPGSDEWPLSVRLASRHEPLMARALRSAFAAALSVVDDAALEAAVAVPDVDLILSALKIETSNGNITAALRPRLLAAFLDGVDVGIGALADVGVAVALKRQTAVVSFDAINAEAVRWARRHAGSLVIGSAEVKQVINAIISAQQALGIPSREIARRLHQMMRVGIIGLDPRRITAIASFEARLREAGVDAANLSRRVARYADAQRRSRALLIARTESAFAVGHGQQVLWSQAVKERLIDPATMGKQWLVTADDITCPVCENMDGETVPINDTFSGGVLAPPRHPACRCATGLVNLPKKSTLT